ncbi:hypothetical protein ACGFYZ_10140 [Streptomyces sp. NPDC048330]
MARAVEASEGVAARSLERLKEDGLLDHDGSEAPHAPQGYRLAP